ncbi:MAG: hypothetical protein N2512_04950, partial [Armatimonadetes bacterium]|nr:hypothetical protein [Armatimonadota bacterium]
RPAARFIAAEVPLGARLLTVGAWSEFISPYHIKLEVLSQNWHRRFAARDLKIAEYPSLEWEPWRVWRLSLQALLRLRRPDMRPPRPQTAPEYVAVVSVIGDSYVLRATADLQARLVLEPWREKMLPGGTSVTIYRCLGWSNRRSVGPNTAP